MQKAKHQSTSFLPPSYPITSTHIMPAITNSQLAAYNLTSKKFKVSHVGVRKPPTPKHTHRPSHVVISQSLFRSPRRHSQFLLGKHIGFFPKGKFQRTNHTFGILKSCRRRPMEGCGVWPWKFEMLMMVGSLSISYVGALCKAKAVA